MHVGPFCVKAQDLGIAVSVIYKVTPHSQIYPPTANTPKQNLTEPWQL